MKVFAGRCEKRNSLKGRAGLKTCQKSWMAKSFVSLASRQSNTAADESSNTTALPLQRLVSHHHAIRGEHRRQCRLKSLFSTVTMAAIRASLRLVPRSNLCRPVPFSRPASLLQRSYATSAPGQRPADDKKPVEEAEQAQEDLTDANDPGMVRIIAPQDLLLASD